MPCGVRTSGHRSTIAVRSARDTPLHVSAMASIGDPFASWPMLPTLCCGHAGHQIRSFGSGEIDIPHHFVITCSLNVKWTALAFDNGSEPPENNEATWSNCVPRRKGCEKCNITLCWVFSAGLQRRRISSTRAFIGFGNRISRRT